MRAITLVVPVLNEEGTLAETLRSLRSQTLKEYDLLVVDNGSTDRSLEIARQWADQVLVEERPGPAWAMHRGFKAAQGMFIAAADADTVYPERWLATMVEALQKPGVVAVYGPIGFREGGRTSRALTSIGYALLAGGSRALGVHQVGAANFGMRREAYFEAGGYPPVADLVGPDLRLARRLARLGRVRCVHRLVCYTSNRRFAGRNVLPASWGAFRAWLDVATGREHLRWESHWGQGSSRRSRVRPLGPKQG